MDILYSIMNCCSRHKNQPKSINCPLHRGQVTNGFGYNHNGLTYSTYAPNCIGCPIGVLEHLRGIHVPFSDTVYNQINIKY